MRIAVTIVKNSKGKWHCIATPEMEPSDQKNIAVELRTNGGKYKYEGKEYLAEKAYVLSTTGVIRRFDRISHEDVSDIPETDDVETTGS